MSNLQNLTVIIVTYRTNNEILDNCINSIDPQVKILIVENSEDLNFKKDYENKFKNVILIWINISYYNNHRFRIYNKRRYGS